MTKPTIEQIHKANTGKVSDKWESYLPFYDSLLQSVRDKEISLLEIGVQNGGSLETWAKYFSKATAIVGCDIDERCGRLEFADPRISVLVGDANAITTFNKIKAVCDSYDLVIDDGSHKSGDIIRSFLLYFPLLRPNGVFIAEDTHTLYMNDWGGGILNELSAYAFFKKIVDVINLQFWQNEMRADVYFRTFFPLGHFPSFIADGWIESIEFRNSLVIVRKSSSANIGKLGRRVITGTDAQVTDDPLRVGR